MGNSGSNLPVMVDQMIHRAGVMVVEAHAGEGLVHVPVLVVQGHALARVAVVVMTLDEVVVMTLIVEARGRADPDLTAGAKVVTGAVRTAKARGTMVTREAR